MVVVARFFPADVRGRVFGTITSVVAFAAGVGPVIGGFVAGSLGWPFLFVIPLLTLVAIPFFLRLLPSEERRAGGVDILGAVLVAVGITALIFFLSFSAWYYLAGMHRRRSRCSWSTSAAFPTRSSTLPFSPTCGSGPG